MGIGQGIRNAAVKEGNLLLLFRCSLVIFDRFIEHQLFIFFLVFPWQGFPILRLLVSNDTSGCFLNTSLAVIFQRIEHRRFAYARTTAENKEMCIMLLISMSHFVE